MVKNNQSISAPIQSMRARYAHELSECEGRVSVLKAKLSVLDEILAEQGRGQVVIPVAEKVSGSPEGITEAALWAVSKEGVGQSISISVIRDAMLAGGFVPNGKNFANTLYTTLQRLAKSERINAIKVDGTWFYRAK